MLILKNHYLLDPDRTLGKELRLPHPACVVSAAPQDMPPPTLGTLLPGQGTEHPRLPRTFSWSTSSSHSMKTGRKNMR